MKRTKDNLQREKQAYFSGSLSTNSNKGENTEFMIIQAAIKIIFDEGLPQFSFERIAKLAGVTRPLVHHYFKTKEDLLKKLVLFIRLQYQNYVLENMQRGKNKWETLELYVEYALRWVLDYPSYASVWLLFYHLASNHDWAMKQNTEFVAMGANRITALLEALYQEGRLSKKPTLPMARSMQIYITGMAVTLATESLTKRDREGLIQSSQNEILKKIIG